MSIPNVRWIENVSGSVPGRRYFSPFCGSESEGIPYPTAWSRKRSTTMVRQRPRPDKLLPTHALYAESYLRTDEVYGCLPVGASSAGIGGYAASHIDYEFDIVDIRPADGDAALASIKALNRLNEHGASFGESIATFRATTLMVTRRVNQIAHMANLLRRGNFKGLASLLAGKVPGSLKRIPASRRLADGWLELEFGWKPLIEDVYTGLDIYRNTLVEGSLSNTRANTAYGGFGQKGATVGQTLERMINGGANTSVKVYATVSNRFAATLNDMGLVNPALIAWQTLPFSFVVDWFYPVSSILSSWTADAGYDVEGTCVVTERLTGSLYRGTFVPNSISRLVERTPTAGSPHHVKVSTAHKSDSIWQLGTALALLRQTMGK